MVIKHLHRMAIFARVVELGSFTKAAAALGLGKSVVSQHIMTLEQSLSVTLINRSPRSFSLTQEGRQFHEACLAMLSQAESAVEMLSDMKAKPTGTIKISASYNMALTFLIAELAKFSQQNPGIQFELVLDDAINNLIEDGFDFCLRVGWLKQTNLYAAKLTSFRMIPCASRRFLAGQPPLTTPDDLPRLPWAVITALSHPERLDLVGPQGERTSVRLKPVIRTNTGVAAREFVLSGQFAGFLPDYAVKRELESGELVRLLPDWSTPEGAISAVFPDKNRMSPRVRLLLDHLRVASRAHYGPAGTRGPGQVEPVAKSPRCR